MRVAIILILPWQLGHFKRSDEGEGAQRRRRNEVELGAASHRSLVVPLGYQFDSEGTGVGAAFTVSAFGDVDCDGIYSTFIRVGEVTSENEVRGHYDLLDTNPTE
jgi:hypothetical protein